MFRCASISSTYPGTSVLKSATLSDFILSAFLRPHKASIRHCGRHGRNKINIDINIEGQFGLTRELVRSPCLYQLHQNEYYIHWHPYMCQYCVLISNTASIHMSLHHPLVLCSTRSESISAKLFALCHHHGKGVKAASVPARALIPLACLAIRVSHTSIQYSQNLTLEVLASSALP